MTDNIEDFRGSPDGVKLVQEVLEAAVAVLFEKAEAAKLTETQKVALLMETGSHMLSSGAFSMACMMDPELKSFAFAKQAMEKAMDICKMELAEAIKMERASRAVIKPTLVH